MQNSFDELAIRHLIARYCDAVNRYDADAWITTWADTGQWHFLGQVHRGRADILALWSSVMAQLDFAIMLANSAVLDVGHEQATGRWYTQEIVRTRGERGRSIVGVYDDQYTKMDDQWLIQSRRYHKLYEAPTDTAEVHLPYAAGESA